MSAPERRTKRRIRRLAERPATVFHYTPPVRPPVEPRSVEDGRGRGVQPVVGGDRFDLALPDPLEENSGETAHARLLVARQIGSEHRRVALRLGKGAQQPERRGGTARRPSRRPARIRESLDGGHDPPRDRLAVPQVPILSGGLEGVAEGVSEIQQPPPVPLLRVLRNDRRLDRRRAGQQVEERRLFAREHGVDGVSSAALREVRRPAIQAALNASTSPARKSRSGSVERRRIGEDDARRMERAEQVLSRAVVDARLAADRRVRHRAGRRRHGVPGDPAKEDRGREARDVGDDPSPDGDERVVAPHAGRQRRVGDARDGVEILRLFPVVDLDVHRIRPARAVRTGPAAQPGARAR